MSDKRGSYWQLKVLPPKQFKRLTGVLPKTFKKMVNLVRDKEDSQRAGRKSKLSAEDKVLMTLAYLREYPTLLRLGVDWGVHESTAQRIVTRTEKLLIEADCFHLPGKKSLREADWAIVVVDVGEHPIERPKKTASLLLGQEKAPYPQSSDCH